MSERDLIRSLRQQNSRLRLELAALKLERLAAASERICLTCGGIGTIAGFWLGTVKKCPACNGRGRS